ncbi:hypothetical protein O3M35_000396 [Rhynocoris fuscipes]|uniref:V-type proton ATPase subunit E n=1 Tax=Rhynocoris fuscipes TaxID=488301 RepID=A0AAW1DLD7_9HEMI
MIADISSQVERMVAFMDQEGEERTKEMLAKAEEEYNIYVGHLLQTEKVRIDAAINKKMKTIERMRKVSTSTARNEARLEVLGYRRSLVTGIFNQVREKIVKEIENDPEKYKNFMENMILEGLYRILEQRVGIRVRKEDVDLASEVIENVCNKYTETTKMQISIVLDKSQYLPTETLGGVYLSAKKGKIIMENTLANKLLRLQHDAAPIVRRMLFASTRDKM